MRPSPSRRAIVAGAVAFCTAVTAAASGSAGASGPHWASATTATIHPGTAVTIAQTTCTVGFLLTDGRNAYLAVPASCSGVVAGEKADGCWAANMPLGLPVKVQGARYSGTFVYSSWIRMQSTDIGGAYACPNNDLTLVKLDPRDVSRANPTVPALGGPTGTATTAPQQFDQLTAYVTAPTQGVALGNSAGNWDHQVSLASPLTVSNTGAPVMTLSGKALGMVSVIPPTTGGTADVHDLGREIAWLNKAPGFGQVHLALGTQPFSGLD